jgi:hypothetical protein
MVTNVEQGRNKSNNVKVTIDGVEKCLVQWCEERGLSSALVRTRIRKYKWSPEEALGFVSRPFKSYKKTPRAAVQLHLPF